MKQIVVISGKGGTGKTVITGAFAALAKNKVMADCDVDAADLHLLLMPEIKERYQFKSGKTAVINKGLCTECGKCVDVCRFSAISKGFTVDPISCDGCGFCSRVCPAQAIKMEENISGEWFVSDTRFGPMVHARLGIAEENSGKLVTLVREEAKKLGESQNRKWIIIDGSPGIGCPVIASISGIDLAVIVTEPTLSGLHDAGRIINTARHFKVNVKVVINKYDLNPDMTGRIEQYCKENNIDIAGKIRFDKSVVKAMVEQKTIIEYQNSRVKDEIINIWKKIENKFS